MLALILAAAAAAGWHYRGAIAGAAGGRGHQAPVDRSGVTGSADDPADANDSGAVETAIPVETTRLSKGGIQRTSSQIGSVQPYEGADLYAKVSGYLGKLHVDYGDTVKKDQVLAEIDDPEVVEDANKAAADVVQAEAAVKQSEAFVESAKADREAAAAALEQAKAEVDRYVSQRSYHQKKYARYQDLVEKRAIPQQIADEEEESYESARASEVASQKAVLNSKAQLTAAAARVAKAEADVNEARASLDVAKAKKARADVLVGYTKIHSPYDGVITRRNFFPGAFIRSASEGGEKPLLTVERTDKVRVVTYVPDRDVPYTDLGDAAEVTLDALPGKVFKGKVSRIAESEDTASRTMHTEIFLDNGKDRLRAGMYGIARIILDSDVKSSTLPAKCLVGEAKDNKGDVYLVKDGKARKTRVTIGADDGLRVEILEGVGPDDRVILNTGSVTDGAPVRDVSADEARPPAAVAETSDPAPGGERGR